MSIGQVVDGSRLVVCVGGGGVGKTTLAAALAVGAAARGRRAMVLTIDPARALGRALGLPRLGSEPERISGADGFLHAAMLDQKRSWDAFIARHAPSPRVRDAIIDNPFYRELSLRFSGAIEYVAIEELCRLSESGEYDVVVLDTPPAAHALDFVRAPERIDRFLSPELSHWLTEAPRHAGRAVRFVVRSLERATGRRTFSELRSFFAAFDELRSDVQRRARTARSLLSAPGTAFLLVTTPTPQSVTESGALRGALDELGIRLAGVIENRAHALPGSIEPGGAEARAESLLAELGESEASAWLRRAHADALARARDERALWQKLRNELPPGVEHATVAELSRDMCALADLRNVAERLWS